MLVLYYALTRIIFSMSRDGLIPKRLNVVNPKTKTPVRVIMVCGIIISLVAGFVSLGALAEIVNIGTLAAFVVVCFGVIALREKAVNNPNAYRNKWHPIIPILGIISCGLLMTFLPQLTWMRFLGWMLIGVLFYFSYSMRHSELN
jgi:APA family basic amino acid/polyamine antiporter